MVAQKCWGFATQTAFWGGLPTRITCLSRELSTCCGEYEANVGLLEHSLRRSRLPDVIYLDFLSGVGRLTKLPFQFLVLHPRTSTNLGTWNDPIKYNCQQTTPITALVGASLNASCRSLGAWSQISLLLNHYGLGFSDQCRRRYFAGLSSGRQSCWKSYYRK